MDATTERLVDFAANLTSADLTDQAIHAAKRSIIDSIGCAFGSLDGEPIGIMHRYAAKQRSDEPATLIGTDIRTTAEMAALVNGGMVRYLDFSDDYFGGTGDLGPHPSDNTGGVLAAAEVAGAGGEALIRGFVLAYEVVDRVVDDIDLRGVSRKWDYGVFHAMSTSLAAANILGLSPAATRDALALATIPNYSLNRARIGQLSHWKAFAGPNGSRGGLFAALLAREGLTGPSDPLEGAAGLLAQLDQALSFNTFGGGGEPYKIEETFFKSIPVRYTTQLPVTVAIGMRDDVDPDDVDSIQVHVVKRYAFTRDEHPEHWAPQSRETSDHSLPYLVAVSLIDGEISPATFTPARYHDPAVLALLDKVDLVHDPDITAEFPDTFRVRIEVGYKSGRRTTAEGTNPKGHPANPMTDDDIEAKFLKQVEPHLGAERASALLATLWELETVDDIGALFPMMLRAC